MANGEIPLLPKPEAQLLVADKAAPHEVIQQQVSNQDYLVLRYAVVGLLLALVISLVGVIALTWVEKDLPEGLIAIGSAAVGSLATMLVRPPSNFKNGQ